MRSFCVGRGCRWLSLGRIFRLIVTVTTNFVFRLVDLAFDSLLRLFELAGLAIASTLVKLSAGDDGLNKIKWRARIRGDLSDLILDFHFFCQLIGDVCRICMPRVSKPQPFESSELRHSAAAISSKGQSLTD